MSGRVMARLLTVTLIAWFIAVANVGCGSYKLQGRVISGTFPSVNFVEPGDDRLNGAGVPGATVELVRDPQSLSAQSMGQVSTDGQGNFSLPVDSFGAGWLEEEWLLRVRHPRATMVEQLIRLPGNGKMTLVTLTAGRDTFTPREDLMKEMERFR